MEGAPSAPPSIASSGADAGCLAAVIYDSPVNAERARRALAELGEPKAGAPALVTDLDEALEVVRPAQIILVACSASNAEALWATLVATAHVPVLWLPESPASALPARLTLCSALNGQRATAQCEQDDDEARAPIDHSGVHVASGRLRAGELSIRVTATQSDLLEVLLAQRGQWISSAELWARAFGRYHAGHESLLRVHMYQLRRRLGPLARYLHSSKGKGYAFRLQSAPVEAPGAADEPSDALPSE